MAASVQLSPSCWAHILQHSQPSVMRLTPSGQRGGEGGHSHGHLQNWGREEVVSSCGAAVGAMAVGSRERAVARPPPAAATAVTAASAQGRSHLMPGSGQHRHGASSPEDVAASRGSWAQTGRAHQANSS